MSPSLHAGLIARARPVRMPRPDMLSPAVPLPLAEALCPVKPARTIAADRPRASYLGKRRFGLTVRVSHETREVLEHLREQTGQTFQHILHDAVTSHLRHQ